MKIYTNFRANLYVNTKLFLFIFHFIFDIIVIVFYIMEVDYESVYG